MAKLPRWLGSIFLVLVIAGLIFVLQPAPLGVEVAQVELRPFAQTVEEQGRTRARNPFTVASPVAGRLLRPELDEGNRVTKDQVIARIAPIPQDQRSRVYAEATISSAEARMRAAEASLREAQGEFDHVSRELARREELLLRNLTSVEEVENYRQLTAAAESRAMFAESSLTAALADVDSARSLLIGTELETRSENPILEILAPADGTILRVYEENEKVIQAGSPIYALSNNDELEIVVDLLTQDAVLVEPGDSVRVTGWGGDRTINAIVQYIEPEAFTKISALGVEEQRVNVIAELLDAPENLGAEYRIEVSIVTWQEPEVLTIPTSALFQRADGWNTFVVLDAEKVELRPLLIGYRGREYTQVIDGVSEGDTVVVFPSDLINDGTRVAF